MKTTEMNFKQTIRSMHDDHELQEIAKNKWYWSEGLGGEESREKINAIHDKFEREILIAIHEENGEEAIGIGGIKSWITEPIWKIKRYRVGKAIQKIACELLKESKENTHSTEEFKMNKIELIISDMVQWNDEEKVFNIRAAKFQTFPNKNKDEKLESIKKSYIEHNLSETEIWIIYKKFETILKLHAKGEFDKIKSYLDGYPTYTYLDKDKQEVYAPKEY